MVAVPAVGVTRPSSIRSVVVLPAPLGPRNPVTLPGCDVEAEVVDGDDVAEAFGQAVYLDGSHVRTVRPVAPPRASPARQVRVSAETADPGCFDLRLVGEDVADVLGYRRVMRGREP